ncbi:MAG: gephyrin-like molybdotransferase Glp [Thermodesulfobacteriota bacterium]
MVSIADAIEAVMTAVVPTPVEEIGIAAAGGRVLAQEVTAPLDIPPFENSQMDGFAVRSADLAGASPAAPIGLHVIGTAAAGRAADRAVGRGQAIRIMTGAPLPEGADAVVKVEDTRLEGPIVEIAHAPAHGEFVRPVGEDLRAGETVLRPGRALRAADVGLLASMGFPAILVRARPRVAVIATGDELVPLGGRLGPGQIYNSNAYTLAAAVREVGATPTILGIVPDDREAMRAAFASCAGFDAILSTGGVSVGDFDFVKQIMDELGLERRFWQVAQKPGKPLTFAARGGRLYFGLPGNPVSSLVCFALYVAPALRRAMGLESVFAPSVEVQMARGVRTARSFTELVRCTLEWRAGSMVATPTGTQSSGVLRSLSLADCLVISPPGQDELAPGARPQALLLGQELTLSPTHPFA